MNIEPQIEGLVMPALLRHARVTYGSAMRRALADAGYDDIPRNGLWVIGGLEVQGSEVSGIASARVLRLNQAENMWVNAPALHHARGAAAGRDQCAGHGPVIWADCRL